MAQRARAKGDSCELIRDQIDSAGHHLTWVKFPDGETRVLVDKDIASEQGLAVESVHINTVKPSDFIPMWEDWDVGGES
jgi:hypothetical protein